MLFLHVCGSIDKINVVKMKKLVRSKDKVFGGVCAGVADFFGLNVRLLRFVWVLSALLFGASIVFYVLLWVLMPDAANEKMSFEERMKNRLGK